MTQQALTEGHTVTAVTRHPEDFPLSHPSVPSLLLDVPAPGETFFFRKVLEPLIARTARRPVYDDMRRMERIVCDSDRVWTVLRSAGLFDADGVSDYRVAISRPPGRFTSRADLADALLREVTGDLHPHAFVDVRTAEGIPRILDVIWKEAFGGRR
ncbi:NAD(P)H-binding protein [Streptomyces griseorubiginosus]|uniref:NAD(P)H-binding protein n=1 Tax=Streptomyces griseorubiginosus TaxID=67304 RepID=UPI001AD61CC7|nr:NAD(P)H-binding protein [Streptomyces griseorubiginosus]MBO4258873.1 NAD(P)H-binding protein [Streptomyces griseorubiginosus]